MRYRKIRDDRFTHYVTYRVRQDDTETDEDLAHVLQMIASYDQRDHGEYILELALDEARARCALDKKPAAK